MKLMKWICLFGIACIFVSCAGAKKTTLYLIGDSTVKSGEGQGENQHWGWGSFFDQYFTIPVENHAKGGRSTRTFITEGRWDSVLNRLRPGDYILMQFGHNDQSPLDDTARARGTMKGIADDSVEIYNPILQKKEFVYTYGKYLRKYIDEAREKKATIIVLSPVPRVRWVEGKVVSMNDYAGWAEEIAKEKSVPYINLNKLISDEYSRLGEEKVLTFFPVDKTHTNEVGAKLIAEQLAKAINKENSQGLYKYKN
jgi:rhamnogalacturonan acetylesterase